VLADMFPLLPKYLNDSGLGRSDNQKGFCKVSMQITWTDEVGRYADLDVFFG